MNTKLSGITQSLNNVANFKVTPDLFANFPRDFPQSKFDHKKLPPPPFNFLRTHKKHKSHKSWLDMINPFECESDYEDDDEGGDYGD